MNEQIKMEYFTCPNCGFTLRSTKPEEIRQLKQLRVKKMLKCPICRATL